MYRQIVLQYNVFTPMYFKIPLYSVSALNIYRSMIRRDLTLVDLNHLISPSIEAICSIPLMFLCVCACVRVGGWCAALLR